jgi:hypothetical protein
MAGGQKIDSHEFWAGSKGSASVFPDGPHKTKMESSATGAGELTSYEDTTEMLKAQQVKGVKKIHAHPREPLMRN